VDGILQALGTAIGGLRIAFLVSASALGVLCAVDWGVRTRRLNAFSPFARGTRRLMAPIIAPVERRVVRAGGVPSSAPWWTLAAVVVGGILILSGLDLVRHELANLASAARGGVRGIAHLMIRWTFTAFYLALLITVIASWIRLNPFGRLVRAARAVTEPVLRPIRRLIPPLGMIDLSPLIAYFAMRYLLEPLLLRLL
jgi:YggT family protein